MKIINTCMQCTQQDEGHLQVISLANKPIYEFTCPQGHENVMVIQTLKYELLFESGIYAFLDGYYREAVTSFHVGLERFYDFIVTSVIGYRKSISVEDIEPLIKKIYMSERTTGAYAAMIFLELGTPLLFDSKYKIAPKIKGYDDPINFRNKVIHEGYIPTKEQAQQYGEAIGNYIHEILEMFNQIEPKIVDNGIMIYTVSHQTEAKATGKYLSVLSYSTYLNCLTSEHIEFADYLKKAHGFRDRYWI